MSGKWKNIFERQKPALIGAAALAALILYFFLYAGGQSESMPVMNEQEQRLAGMLSSMEGVGRVEVMITGGEVAAAFSYDGSSQYEDVQGVLICAEGAEDMQVYLRLQRAVAAALNLPAESIEIYPLKREE